MKRNDVKLQFMRRSPQHTTCVTNKLCWKAVCTEKNRQETLGLFKKIVFIIFSSNTSLCEQTEYRYTLVFPRFLIIYKFIFCSVNPQQVTSQKMFFIGCKNLCKCYSEKICVLGYFPVPRSSFCWRNSVGVDCSIILASDARLRRCYDATPKAKQSIFFS